MDEKGLKMLELSAPSFFSGAGANCLTPNVSALILFMKNNGEFGDPHSDFSRFALLHGKLIQVHLYDNGKEM